MKFLSSILVLGLLVNSCNSTTESSNTTDNTTGSAPNILNDRSTDTAMMQNRSVQLTEAMQKMMSSMKAMTMSGNADMDFAKMMSIHHQGAIDLSQVEMNEGKNEALKSMAKQIDSASRKEITVLDSVAAKNTGENPTVKSAFSQNAMQLMDTSSVVHMTHSGNIDDDYSEMMIKHHRDGIAMARLYLKSAKNPTTKKIANKIIAQQPEEIKKLEQLNKQVK